MHTPSGQLPVVKLWNHSKHSIRKAPRLAELAGKWLQSLGVLPFLSLVQLPIGRATCLRTVQA